MRVFVFVYLVVLVAVGQAFRTAPWVRGLTPMLDNVQNAWSNLVTRSPRRGGGSGGDDDDDDEDDGISSAEDCIPVSESCFADEKNVCSDGCIPSDAVCCMGWTFPKYCQSGERCVSTGSTGYCCLKDDFGCDEFANNETLATYGERRQFDSAGSRVPVLRVGSLLLGGVMIALGGRL